MRSTPRLEAFLARVYTADAVRERVYRDAAAEARLAGLTEEEVAAVSAMDLGGLAFAAHSFARKRDGKSRRPWWRRWA